MDYYKAFDTRMLRFLWVQFAAETLPKTCVYERQKRSLKDAKWWKIRVMIAVVELPLQTKTSVPLGLLHRLCWRIRRFSMRYIKLWWDIGSSLHTYTCDHHLFGPLKKDSRWRGWILCGQLVNESGFRFLWWWNQETSKTLGKCASVQEKYVEK